jgi:hypothetical protein
VLLATLLCSLELILGRSQRSTLLQGLPQMVSLNNANIFCLRYVHFQELARLPCESYHLCKTDMLNSNPLMLQSNCGQKWKRRRSDETPRIHEYEHRFAIVRDNIDESMWDRDGSFDESPKA